MREKSNIITGLPGLGSGTGRRQETAEKSPVVKPPSKPREFGVEMVLSHLEHIDQKISVLKSTIERRVYDEVIDGAIQSLELRLFLLRNEVEKYKEKK